MSKLIPITDDKEKWKQFFLQSMKTYNNSVKGLRVGVSKGARISLVSPNKQILKSAQALVKKQNTIKGRKHSTKKQKNKIKAVKRSNPDTIFKKRNVSA